MGEKCNCESFDKSFLTVGLTSLETFTISRSQTKAMNRKAEGYYLERAGILLLRHLSAFAYT